MSHIGEFDLIRRISAQFKNVQRFARVPEDKGAGSDASSGTPAGSEASSGVVGSEAVSSGVVGIGDDCAVMPQREGLDTLVTTDLLVEDRHFLLSDVSPEQLGWKSAAVNISDIAAMGGRPTAAFLSIALPKELPTAAGRQEGLRSPATKMLRGRSHFQSRPETLPSPGASGDSVSEWVDKFIAGFREMSARFGVPLLGGDTSASPDKLFINVTVLGECPHRRALLRSGARPGDLICVTGPLGDSAAGLKLILERHAAGVSPEVHPDGPPAAKSPQNDVGGPTLGTSGDTAASLILRQSDRESPADGEGAPEDILIRRHYLPMPRVKEGMALRDCPGVHAMMDISDGIASDLRHILEASSVLPSSNLASFEDGVPKNDRLSSNQASFEDGTTVLGAEIDLAALPLSPEMREVCAGRGWDAAELAVSGGEDYELLVTMAPEALEAARTALGGRLYVIGRVLALPPEQKETPSETDLKKENECGPQPVIRWIGGDKDYKGFSHF